MLSFVLFDLFTNSFSKFLYHRRFRKGCVFGLFNESFRLGGKIFLLIFLGFSWLEVSRGCPDFCCELLC